MKKKIKKQNNEINIKIRFNFINIKFIYMYYYINNLKILIK